MAVRPRYFPAVLAAWVVVATAGRAGQPPGMIQPVGPVPAPPAVRPPNPPQPTPVIFTQVWIVPMMLAVVFLIRKQREQEEEEEMTAHLTADAGPLEYKILRSTTGAFKHPAKLRAALDDEARAGWELFELLDASRLRLRRPVRCRDADAELAQDPYRIYVGTGQGLIAFWIVLGTIAITLVVVGVLAVVLK